MGFRGSKAAAASVLPKIAARTMEHGLKKVKVFVKGPGSGRKAPWNPPHMGIEVTEIVDITPMPHNGCRPPKHRRV